MTQQVNVSGVRRLEVCVDRLSDAKSAVGSGADRIELCASLALGGVTPSLGCILGAVKLMAPVIVLIRPTLGGFCYHQLEVSQMIDDIKFVKEAGLAGVAIGALTADDTLDVEVMHRLCDAAGDMEIVLHRAFDLVSDPKRTLDEAVDLGVMRVLTSGQKPKAIDGLGCLRNLVDHADGRIEILPGSGVTPDNAVALIEGTGVTQLHSSCRAPVTPDSNLVALGFSPEKDAALDVGLVKLMKSRLEVVQ
ncbi:copper homeostasis protein CutC [Pacificibacter sp. AS14]|uniref:copper homeostasis protein CutC n=1 Tax=Pacificibacter sp. AS14 TaxID=3135785 RepID=UPI00317E214F